MLSSSAFSKGRINPILQRQKKLTDGSISENWRDQYTSLLKAFFIKN